MILTTLKVFELTEISLLGLMFGPGLLYSDHEPHKRQRKMLNPMFSPANTRALTPSIYDVAHKVRPFVMALTFPPTSPKLSQKMSDMIRSEGAGTGEVDMLKLASATAMDVIGSAGLGHNFDALGKEDTYVRAAKQFM